MWNKGKNKGNIMLNIKVGFNSFKWIQFVTWFKMFAPFLGTNLTTQFSNNNNNNNNELKRKSKKKASTTVVYTKIQYER